MEAIKCSNPDFSILKNSGTDQSSQGWFSSSRVSTLSSQLSSLIKPVLNGAVRLNRQFNANLADLTVTLLKPVICCRCVQMMPSVKGQDAEGVDVRWILLNDKVQYIYEILDASCSRSFKMMRKKLACLNGGNDTAVSLLSHDVLSRQVANLLKEQPKVFGPGVNDVLSAWSSSELSRQISRQWLEKPRNFNTSAENLIFTLITEVKCKNPSRSPCSSQDISDVVMGLGVLGCVALVGYLLAFLWDKKAAASPCLYVGKQAKNFIVDNPPSCRGGCGSYELQPISDDTDINPLRSAYEAARRIDGRRTCYSETQV